MFNSSSSSNRKAILALLLLVPVASFGVATPLYFLPGVLGNLVAIFSKIWMLIVPIVWLFFIEPENLNLKVQQAQGRNLLVGLGLGLLMLGIILIIYRLLGPQWIDVEYVRERAM
ncbi:MAG: hypothetical protein KME32_29600 [Mojavia pulchra JT2-VF2]|jgi:membrane protease YdiL (CAAX protease family)|uniref:Uncharacterized protein n=1 Tax=Mojavia pulchra JT2-VF2 TaxID=287848 RepID=A0A951Q4I9_9NOST|nr:hypothetical protein [Mojavia pulchra JT2-VF2]